MLTAFNITAIIILMMEVVINYETPVSFYKTAQRNTPADSQIQAHQAS
jgi:hypothetical protein